MAVLRLDFLTAYMSDQVIKGFTTGAAVHVFVAQLNKIFGVTLPRHSGFGKLFRVSGSFYTNVRFTLFSCVICNPLLGETLTVPLAKLPQTKLNGTSKMSFARFLHRSYLPP